VTDTTQLKRAATAAGVAGAAVVAGRAGFEALRGDGSTNGGSGRSTAYRLKRKEPLGDGLRRIALGRVDDALDHLRDPDADPAEAVHEARKDLKKVRSVLRLARGRLGDELYRAENARFRDAGQRLSGARDAQVKLETLDQLSERTGDRLTAQRIRGLRERLEAERGLEAGAERGDATAQAADEIEAGRKRIAEWPLEGEDWGIVAPGVRRAYRRGRNRLADAAVEPSVENLHEWRKRVKDLWYSLRILSPAWPDVAKPLADQAHELSDLLGDDHDLAVLATAARESADAFDDPGDLDVVLEAIGERRAELQHNAVSLGRRIYADKPGAFSARLESWWRAWRADTGARVATG